MSACIVRDFGGEIIMEGYEYINLMFTVRLRSVYFRKLQFRMLN